ncbi:MAG: GAF domain-containing protein [Deltaproteobacteria bacterium]|nr:GAF domain-containing protein [Deltaproteobacteria bacterium]
MQARLLEGLRQIREVDWSAAARDATRLLELVAAATGSARVTLCHAPQSGLAPVVVAHPTASTSAALARLELKAASTREQASLVFEREGSFTREDAEAAELVGHAALLRLAQLQAEDRAARSARELDLLRSVTIAGAEVMRFSEVADRVAKALVLAFRGLHVLIHMLADDHLELVARRLEQGDDGLPSAPEWSRRMALSATFLQTLAVHERKIVSKAVSELPERTRAHLEPLGVRRMVVAPLMSEQRVVGTLTIAYRTDSPQHEAEQQLVDTASRQLGVAMAQLALLEKERRLVSELAVINELGALVAQQHELAAVLSTAVHHLARLCDVPVVRLRLANAERTELVSVACTVALHPEISVRIDGDSAASLAFREQRHVIIDDARTDPRTFRTMAEKVGAYSALAVPLIARGESIGAMVLVENRRPRKFTTEEVSRANTVANLLSPMILNAKMFDDLRKSYDALGRAQAELVEQERLAALGQLSAVIAHEVRNPLGVIYNSLGELRRITPPTNDANQVLDIVAEEAARLNRIVVDLLDFVKPYAPHPRPARVGDVLHAAIDSAKRATSSLQVTVRAEIDSPQEEILVDGTMLGQALINLVVNAIQASPRDGVVTLRARRKGPTLCCEVLDDGPGVDAANAKRIFEPFFTTKATGTGLGLAVVGRITDALGGRIELSRSMSGGAAFTLMIPVSVEEECATSADVSVSSK